MRLYTRASRSHRVSFRVGKEGYHEDFAVRVRGREMGNRAC